STFRKITERIDSWQIKLASQRNDKLAPKGSDRTGRYDNTTIWLPRKCREGWLDFTRIAYAGRCYCHSYRAGGGFDHTQEPHVCSRLGMMKECYPPNLGRHLFENFQPLPAQLRFEIVEPGNVSARMCQVRNEAASDRIGDERKDDRNSMCLV